jgi:hypothetical protein
MTAGMVGFGALLWTRHRLLARDGALADPALREPRRAGQRVLIVTAIIAAIVALIIGSHWHAGKPIGLLSVAMPLVGLGWLAAIGLKLRQLPESAAEGAGQSDRASRRPPKRDSVAPPLTSPGQASSNRHASL